MTTNVDLVTQAFSDVAVETGYGATLKEIDLALRAAGHDLNAQEISDALRGNGLHLRVRSARTEDDAIVTRGGWVVWLAEPVEVTAS